MNVCLFSLLSAMALFSPIEDEPAPPASEPTPIVLLGPNAGRSEVSYTLNDRTFKIRPGQIQKLQTDRQWTIRFQPRAGTPRITYRLEAGYEYQFRSTAQGWQLVRLAPADEPYDPIPATAPTSEEGDSVPDPFELD